MSKILIIEDEEAIADLEKEWGISLLQRNKKGVCLTSSGKQILPYVRKIVSDFEEIQQKVNEINGIQSGTVRIGTFSSVAINWLPDVFARFQKDYPGIDYEMLLGDYEEVEKWIGHAPGGVCPFGIKEGVKVYLDESLKQFDTVYPAAGNDHSAVKLTIAELEEVAGAAGWVDVCKEPA